jgi:predicted nucleic acid-binding protein|tara:strand:+ start:493 stop:693 length:201 start_codon:yes stop_codon:yes gene_type:complete
MNYSLDTPIGIRMTKEDTSKLQELAENKRVNLSTYCRSVLATHLKYKNEKISTNTKKRNINAKSNA